LGAWTADPTSVQLPFSKSWIATEHVCGVFIPYLTKMYKKEKIRKPRKGAAVIAASMHGFANCPKFKSPVRLTLTRSKVKVNLTGHLNFGQLAKPCMLAAMTAASLRGFLVFSHQHTQYV